MSEPEEFEDLLKIYNRYPLEELIVHPRLQKDLYKNTPNLDVFAMAAEESRNPLCYNGDICNAEDMKRLRERFPKLDCVMVGRGVLADPALGRVLKGGGQAEKAELRKFHDLLYRAYCEEMSGDRTVLYKMKELWFYFSGLFTNGKKVLESSDSSGRQSMNQADALKSDLPKFYIFTFPRNFRRITGDFSTY